MNAFELYDRGEVSRALTLLREMPDDPAAQALVDLTENRPAAVLCRPVESEDPRYWELRSIAAWRAGDVAELGRAVARISDVLGPESDPDELDELTALLAVAELAEGDLLRRTSVGAPIRAPFDPSLSHVVVEMDINGATARMIVDTGAEMTLVDRTFAGRAGIRFPTRGTVTAGTNDGDVAMSIGMVDRIAFLGIEWSDVPALVVDLSRLRNKLGVDGILGVQDLLSSFALRIDYQAGEMARLDRCTGDGWLLYYTQGRSLISVEGYMEGGTTGLFRVDTGGARSVLTKEYVASSLEGGTNWQVSGAREEVRKVFTESVRERRYVSRLRFLPAGSTGGLELSDVPVDTTMADELIAYAGKLGADAFQGRVLELDYPACRLRLAPLD
jgi:hypothetical protein